MTRLAAGGCIAAICVFFAARAHALFPRPAKAGSAPGRRAAGHHDLAGLGRQSAGAEEEPPPVKTPPPLFAETAELAATVPAQTVAPQGAAEQTPADPARPDLQQPPAHPTRVEIDIEVVEVSQIQDHDQKFDIEFNAYFVWQDPRLAFDSSREGVSKKVLAADELWTPDPLLVDELDVDARGGATAHVQPDGTVFLNRYYRGTITGVFDLHEFPLDRHDLEVALEATSYEADEVEFSVGEVKAVHPEHAVPHGWKLVDISAEAGESRYARTNETFSLLRMTIRVARDPHFYLWSIILPLIPIMATAWSVFWMDPKEFSSQVGVGITAMLTVVAYRITIDSSLPPLTYMTRMDYFLLVCQTFVFIAFMATVAIHVLYALDVPHMPHSSRAADRNQPLAAAGRAGGDQSLPGLFARSLWHRHHSFSGRCRGVVVAAPPVADSSGCEDSYQARDVARDCLAVCPGDARAPLPFPQRNAATSRPPNVAPAKCLAGTSIRRAFAYPESGRTAAGPWCRSLWPHGRHRQNFRYFHHPPGFLNGRGIGEMPARVCRFKGFREPRNREKSNGALLRWCPLSFSARVCRLTRWRNRATQQMTKRPVPQRPRVLPTRA